MILTLWIFFLIIVGMKDQVLELCSDEYTDDQLFIDEKFDSCIIGVCFDPQGGFTTAYSLDKILNFLVKNEKMTENESIKYFNTEIMDKSPDISFIKEINEDPDLLSNYNNEMLFLDGYSPNCIMGVRLKKDSKIVSAYSDFDCIQSLMENDDMSEEDAIEFFEYNTRGSYVGEHTPVFVTLF